MSKHQYKITVNDAQGTITDHIEDAKWARICDIAECRGGCRAKLERRLVTDPDIKQLLTNTQGWIFTDTLAISPWETLAESCDN